MKYQLSISTRFFSTTVALLFVLIPLQAQNQITKNPQAEKLRRIWFKKGTGTVLQEVGRGAGALPDINNDGANEYAVLSGHPSVWEVYLGGNPLPDSVIWRFDTSTSYLPQPVVGDFFGTGEKYIGFTRQRIDTTTIPGRWLEYVQLHFFKVEGDSIRDEVSMLWDAGLTMNPPVRPAIRSAWGIDLDKDGDDELVLVSPVYSEGLERSTETRIWIYEGGEGFDLSEPDYVIRDSEPNDDRPVSASVRDLDADGFLDIILGIRFRTGWKMKFWWGTENSPSDWTDEPDRILPLSSDSPAPQYSYAGILQDFDGDGKTDFLGALFSGDDAGTYMWLSSSDPDFRNRSLDQTDYDRYYKDVIWTRGFGHVADSTGRYDMLAVFPDPGPDIAYGLSGGKEGPNDTYDAFFGGGDGPSFGGVSAGDVNDDGYEDRILNSSSYGGPGVGIAAIISGGSYIPVDDTTLSVRSIATQEHEAALHIWPNPVIDELHIAWRGDLQKRPSQLAVFDMRGREVVRDEVNYWRGEAIWECGSVASGAYLLVVYDDQGAILASEEVIVQ